ncbi:uncharacterized protein FA14DRAFT_182037 [Meira miltonrushii]|uniref:Uncharacterized protein n=1 Tax=Meira miltonrushii TaxID=1280837 RepID=A0A316V4E6_9BASI|nr:uncharacterized protein FA14DRAFT_182037 [Meira miltonrushii]PWN32124.1 hypothetical protein FA14DRAFT_182037 [Meira miltonrushii]
MQRSLFTASTASTQTGQPKSFLRAATIVPSITTLMVAHHYFSSSSVLHAESSSDSSSKFRQADSAALRRPASQLFFMSIKGEHRDEWQNWIGYFRQAGYDCIDSNIALSEGTEENDESLSDEIGSQIRLMSLQRAPLLFAYSGQGARAALHHIQSSKPKISGLVLVNPKDTDQATVESAEKLDVKKLRILILSDQEDEQAFRKTERWMDSEGLS